MARRGCVQAASSAPRRDHGTLRAFFFFNDTATTEIYTLSLHDALPISPEPEQARQAGATPGGASPAGVRRAARAARSEEHTSELQSRSDLVCRLLLEKKKKKTARSRVPSQQASPPRTH